MAKVIVTTVVEPKISRLNVVQTKLNAAVVLANESRQLASGRNRNFAAPMLAESQRLLREVVELLASAVGLRVSAETAAKRKPSRKRARSKSAEGGTSKPAPATAQPPKKNGLPVAKPWENPGLPDVQPERA